MMTVQAVVTTLVAIVNGAGSWAMTASGLHAQGALLMAATIVWSAAATVNWLNVVELKDRNR